MSFLAPSMPKAPKPVAPIPVPTIDDAQRNRNEVNRLRKRRGVQANIIAGAFTQAPAVGTTTLLGGKS